MVKELFFSLLVWFLAVFVITLPVDDDLFWDVLTFLGLATIGVFGDLVDLVPLGVLVEGTSAVGLPVLGLLEVLVVEEDIGGEDREDDQCGADDEDGHVELVLVF